MSSPLWGQQGSVVMQWIWTLCASNNHVLTRSVLWELTLSQIKRNC